MRYVVAFILGFTLRSILSYLHFYSLSGVVYWFIDLGQLVEGLLTLDWYLISRCFATLFLV